jgi:transcriptional regulator GlxA family with amidase domain
MLSGKQHAMAIKIGFMSQTHMFGSFRKLYGQAPSRMRQSLQVS